MRKMEAIMGAAIWIAAAALLPMLALEPVTVGAAAKAGTIVAAQPCGEGSVALALGCTSVQL
jgi:hypothetical protein